MNSFIKKAFIISIIGLHFVIIGTPISYAQKFSPVVAISGRLKATDKDIAEAGYIVAKDPNEYYITRSYQDQYVAGVITNESDLLYTFENDEEYTTIAVEGTVKVWISNNNGNVLVGDPVTTSTVPGVGIKADNESAILGFAMESMPQDIDDPVLISVQLNNAFARPQSLNGSVQSSLLEKTGSTISRLLDNVVDEATNQYSKSLLYLAVILIIVLANLFGFMIFGRIAVNGIYAVGRNPLAKRTIIKTILLNVGMTIIFTVGSIAVALILLRY